MLEECWIMDLCNTAIDMICKVETECYYANASYNWNGFSGIFLLWLINQKLFI
jgi:hypothetical protein